MPKPLSLLLPLLLSLSLASHGCAVFDALRPALTAATLTLLLELEALLREYETASIPQNSPPGAFLVFNASQDALYRNINQLLDQHHAQIPKPRLRAYRARLHAASPRSP